MDIFLSGVSNGWKPKYCEISGRNDRLLRELTTWLHHATHFS